MTKDPESEKRDERYDGANDGRKFEKRPRFRFRRGQHDSSPIHEVCKGSDDEYSCREDAHRAKRFRTIQASDKRGEGDGDKLSCGGSSDSHACAANEWMI